MSALDAATDALRRGVMDAKVARDDYLVAAAVVRAYLDALDPADVTDSTLDLQTKVGLWRVDAVLKAVRP